MGAEGYRVVFRGELVAGVSRIEAEANMQSRFKYGDAALARLFSGKAVVLKSGLDRETAEKYAKALAKIGLVCDLLPPEEPAAPAPVTVVEPPAPVVEPPAPVFESPAPAFEPPESVFEPSAPPVMMAAAPEPVAPDTSVAEPEADAFAESVPDSYGVPAEAEDIWSEPVAREESVATAEPVAPIPEPVVAAPEAAPEAPLPESAAPAGAVSGAVLDALQGTRPWVRLISILLFLGAGLGVLGVVLMVAGSMLSGVDSGVGAPMMPIYLAQGLACLLYLVPAYYLSKYASAIDALAKGGGMTALETALGHQKSFWRFSGILALVFLLLGILGVLAAILIPQLA